MPTKEPFKCRMVVNDGRLRQASLQWVPRPQAGGLKAHWFVKTKKKHLIRVIMSESNDTWTLLRYDQSNELLDSAHPPAEIAPWMIQLWRELH